MLHGPISQCVRQLLGTYSLTELFERDDITYAYLPEAQGNEIEVAIGGLGVIPALRVATASVKATFADLNKRYYERDYSRHKLRLNEN